MKTKELEGKKMNFIELDNEMMNEGFHTVFNEGLNFLEEYNNGVLLFGKIDEKGEEQTVTVLFTGVEKNIEKPENSIIEIKKVEV